MQLVSDGIKNLCEHECISRFLKLVDAIVKLENYIVHRYHV